MIDSFLKLDEVIQKIPDQELQQECIIAMIGIISDMCKSQVIDADVLSKYINTKS